MPRAKVLGNEHSMCSTMYTVHVHVHEHTILPHVCAHVHVQVQIQVYMMPCLQ